MLLEPWTHAAKLGLYDEHTKPLSPRVHHITSQAGKLTHIVQNGPRRPTGAVSKNIDNL